MAIAAIPASALYVQTLNRGAASEEGQTTSIRTYAFIEELPGGGSPAFLLDVEHRVYTYYDDELEGYTSGPIVVPQDSCKELRLTFEVVDTVDGIDLLSSEDLIEIYDIFATGIGHLSTEASVEVPRMPSECAIGWYLDGVDYDTLTVTAIFANPPDGPSIWSVGRPLVRVNAILVIGVPEAVVVIVTAELSPPLPLP